MKFFTFAVSALLASTTCVPVLGVRGRPRELRKDKSSSDEEKMDTSQQLLPCLAYEPKSKKKSSKSGEEKIGIPECPCCNQETCEYFMEFDFCKADGFEPFDLFSSAACRYYDEPSVAGSLVAIDLLEFGSDICSGMAYNTRKLASKFEYGSFGYCCENIVGSCHEAKVPGCCDETRRNRRMNEISATNERFIKETDGGLHATVETEHEEGLTWLSKHVEEMQNRLEKGDTARSWDPLFRAYFANSKDIEMKCEHSENKVECKTESQTQCGIDLIKAQGEYHSKIAESLRSGGDHVIEEEHLVPKSCSGHY